jgi:hypothetical protein
VLDERKDSAGHESGPAYWFAGAGHFSDLNDAPPGCDFDPATRACSDDFIRPRAIVRGDNDFDSVAFHGTSVPEQMPRSREKR